MCPKETFGYFDNSFYIKGENGEGGGFICGYI